MDIEKNTSFQVTRQQCNRADIWKKRHKCPFKSNTDKNIFRRSYSWVFTNTEMGIAVEFLCSCGKKVDLTDYNDW